MSKPCIICGSPLSAENTTWYRQKNYIHKCNDCTKTEKSEWIANQRRLHPAKEKEKQDRFRAKFKALEPFKYTASQMNQSARKRAAALGLGYDLDPEYILSLCPEKCPVFDEPLKYGGGEKTDFSASLDRIDARIGYVRGNVQVISLLANLMKSRATPEQQVMFAEWIFGGMRSFDKLKGTASINR